MTSSVSGKRSPPELNARSYDVASDVLLGLQQFIDYRNAQPYCKNYFLLFLRSTFGGLCGCRGLAGCYLGGNVDVGRRTARDRVL